MAIITFPGTPGISDIEWTPPAASQVNRSPWTGKRRVTILPVGSWWKCKVSLTAKVGEAAMLVWRDFLLATNGQANSFRIPAVEGPQTSATTVLVNGAGQSGYSLVTDGWLLSGTVLKAGQLITVNDQLEVLAADLIASGGTATMVLRRALRVSPADNDPVEVRLPWALMAMAQDDNPWTVTRGQIYGLSFQCEESF